MTVSNATIPASLDKAMDKATSDSKPAPAGVSVRNGPVVDDDVQMEDAPLVNGSANGKRKSRSSISAAPKYTADTDSDDEDAQPLVRSQCRLCSQC